MAKGGKVSKYDVLAKIAESSFALVYKGRDPFTRRLVAIKLCVAEDETLRARFLREAEGISKLYHPNIARILEFGSGDGKPYLVEEFLEGGDLRARIRSDQPINLVEELDVLLQVAHGLQYAHSKGVLHLDLKPATVHIEKGGTVKLVDFGIARMAGAAIHLEHPESSRSPRGYLPPEQALGLFADARTDIFCFGALAYELLARRPPFSGLTPPELLQESLDETLKPLPLTWPECPPALGALIERCLARSPSQRYRDFDALLDDLEPIHDAARLSASEKQDDPTAGSRPPGGDSPTVPEASPRALPSLDDTMAIPGQQRPPAPSPRSGAETEKLTTAYLLEPPGHEGEGDGEAAAGNASTQASPPPPPLPTPEAASDRQGARADDRGHDDRGDDDRGDDTQQTDAPLPDTRMPDTRMADTRMADTGTADTRMADTGTAGGHDTRMADTRTVDGTGTTGGHDTRMVVDSASTVATPLPHLPAPELATRPGLIAFPRPVAGSAPEKAEAPTPTASPAAPPPPWARFIRDRRFPLIAAAGALVVVLGLVVIALLARSGPGESAPVPQPPVAGPPTLPDPARVEGLLIIDAVPWAEVIRVWDQDGQDIPLLGARHTPLALRVPSGVYQVALAGPDSAEPITCEGIVVSTEGTGTCQVTVRTLRVEDYLKEVGWWR